MRRERELIAEPLHVSVALRSCARSRRCLLLGPVVVTLARSMKSPDSKASEAFKPFKVLPPLSS